MISRVPRPLHAGQAPWGLLKENSRGDEFREADAAVIAGKALREEQFLAVHHRHPHHPVRQLQGQLQGIGEAGPQVRFDDQPVHHRLDGVPLVLVDGGQLLQLQHLAVEADAAVPLAAQPFQELRDAPPCDSPPPGPGW